VPTLLQLSSSIPTLVRLRRNNNSSLFSETCPKNIRAQLANAAHVLHLYMHIVFIFLYYIYLLYFFFSSTVVCLCCDDKKKKYRYIYAFWLLWKLCSIQLSVVDMFCNDCSAVKSDSTLAGIGVCRFTLVVLHNCGIVYKNLQPHSQYD